MQGWFGRSDINRENIKVQAETIDIATFALNTDGADILDFGIALDELASVRVLHVQAAIRTTLAISRDKAFEIRPGHHQVDIVIPRNVTLMSDGTQQCAIGQRISQATLPAESIHILQNIQKDCMYFFKTQFFHITMVLAYSMRRYGEAGVP